MGKAGLELAVDVEEKGVERKEAASSSFLSVRFHALAVAWWPGVWSCELLRL